MDPLRALAKRVEGSGFAGLDTRSTPSDRLGLVTDDGLRARLERIDGERAAAHVQALCSAAMGGRLCGTDGEARAAKYLKAVLASQELGPLDEAAGGTESFEVTVPMLTGEPQLHIQTRDGRREMRHLVDFAVNVQGAAGGGSAEGETVWAGELTGSSLADSTMENRIVVCSTSQRGRPLDPEVGLRAYLERLSRARQAGAVGVLQAGGRPDRRKVMNHLRERPSLVSLDVSGRVVEALFDSRRPTSIGQVGARATVRVPLRDTPMLSVGNVAARIGTGPLRLLLCAHYDHVGSLTDGRWFPGAADNASGVSVLLEVARSLSEVGGSDVSGVGFLFTTGEEVGLCGARHFVQTHADCLRHGVTVVNVDEVAGLPTDPLWLLRSEQFGEELLRAEDRREVGCRIRVEPLTTGQYADHRVFAESGVRSVAALFSPALAPDVAHTLSDGANRIVPDRLAAAARALLLIVHRLTVRE